LLALEGPIFDDRLGGEGTSLSARLRILWRASDEAGRLHRKSPRILPTC
jgi:hypothetical protein